MQQNFYRLGTTFRNKWFRGRELAKDIKIIDKWIGKGMRGFKDIVHVRIVSGTTAGDILGVAFPLHIVSTKLLEIWKDFEKIETYPVVIEGSVSPIEYSGVVFLGRGGPFDPVKSKAVYSKALNEQGNPAIMKQEGMFFDDSYWDCSDLLTIDEFPCVPIVTEKVVKAMKKARVTNCEYIALEEYGIYKKYIARNK